ncbi:hypothetical protein EPO33_02535 [Patescibacteria group bacterium]|nr:MAG: hypothetical protein EPO33_02535 [Patescibacteria group bacterium]
MNSFLLDIAIGTVIFEGWQVYTARLLRGPLRDHGAAAAWCIAFTMTVSGLLLGLVWFIRQSGAVQGLGSVTNLSQITATSFWLITAAAVIAHTTMQVARARGHAVGDMTRVRPLFALTPALVAVVSWLFTGEQATAGALGGVVAIVFGTYLINVPGDSTKNIFTPIRALVERPENRWMLLAILASSFNITLVRQGIVHSDILFFTFLSVFLTGIVTLVIVYLKTRRFTVRTLGPLVFSGLWYTAAVLFLNTALRADLTVYNSALKTAGVLLSMLFAYLFLKERRDFLHRLVAAALIAGGVIAVAILR